MKTQKRTICNIALVFAILCILGVHTSFAQCNSSLFDGGNGTEASPYQISTPEQLQNLNKCLGSSYQDYYYVLNNDIDLTSYLRGAGNNGGEGWQPIGNSSSSFYGKFNGNGHKVSGLWINRLWANSVGLFGYVYNGAELRNIGVEIDDGKGGVTGNSYVGGLAGDNDGTISNSYATGSVTGKYDGGGLVGYNYGTISNSYATGSVTGTSNYFGGLAGYNYGTIVSSYATGNVTGGSGGGLAGNNSGTIVSSYATGNVTGRSGGGLVGSNSGTISNSYATGNATGNGTGIPVGGLVGGNSGTIVSSYATGSVTGNNATGGLVGNNSGTISNSYATGSVTGKYDGGLVGLLNGGIISNSYATGSVTGKYDGGGGLVDWYNSGTISNSYYDKETTGRTDTKGIGKTTAEMKTQRTYEGWDFESIWDINPVKNNGYPILLWQNPVHIASAIVIVSNQTWSGSPITPKPSVYFQGGYLSEGTHFEYSYYNNVQSGTAILRIVGKGTYLGQSKTVEFNIVLATCGTGFAGGTGTEADPYKIAEARNLDAISNCLGTSYSDKYYELQKDIDLGSYLANTSVGWQPIGSSSSSSFSGKFNGNGHKVSGLWINRPLANNVGLFGYVDTGAELRNIGVEIDDGKGSVTSGNYDIGGGLVGRNDGTIVSSYATGNVTGGYVGGLVGRNDGTIVSSYATGNVTGGYVGGLAGSNSGTISNSYATGNVSGDSYVGGLAGSNSGTIVSSYATGSVSGTEKVGGLVGGNASGPIASGDDGTIIN